MLDHCIAFLADATEYEVLYDVTAEEGVVLAPMAWTTADGGEVAMSDTMRRFAVDAITNYLVSLEEHRRERN